MQAKYIKSLSDNGKYPGIKKEERIYHQAADESWLSYCTSYSDRFLKVDIDDFNHKTGAMEEPLYGEPRSETVVWILDELGIKYNGIITEHGKHLFFKKPESMEEKNRQNWLCPLGIRMEWKFPKSDDHIPLKINGVERKFFKGSIDNEDIDELPYFLYPLQKGQKPFEIDFPEGDRTQKLGAYLFYLVDKGYSAEQAFEIVRLINDYVFETPIPDDKNITHSDIAKEIIDNFNLITVNNDFYTYDAGVYKHFPDSKITNYLTECYPKLNINFEREVIRHIKGLTYTEYPEDDGMVNVRNGILKFDDSGAVILLPHSKEHVSFKQFNAIYNPDVKSKLLDDTLLKWFSESLEQIELFNQVLGYLLMNHVNYQKIFFFIGVPSTGKSTLLKLIQEFCGKENVSAIQLDDMNKPFGLASIVNKTANIFSDIRKTKILASDVFKMLANEKYIGDALLQKTYTVDFLSKKRVKNDGIVPQYYVENNHDAIIPRDLYMQVQEEMERRSNIKSGESGKKRIYSSKYALSTIVFCEHCGDIFRRIHWNNHGCKSIVWRCASRLDKTAVDCPARTMREEDLQNVVVQAVNSVFESKTQFMDILNRNIAVVMNQVDGSEVELIERKLEQLQKELVKLANNNQDYSILVNEIYRLRDEKEAALAKNAGFTSQKQRMAEMTKFLKEQKGTIQEYDEQIVRKLIEKITVHDEKVTVAFKSGMEIDVKI